MSIIIVMVVVEVVIDIIIIVIIVSRAEMERRLNTTVIREDNMPIIVVVIAATVDGKTVAHKFIVVAYKKTIAKLLAMVSTSKIRVSPKFIKALRVLNTNIPNFAISFVRFRKATHNVSL